jgi:hypothetical protein
MPLQALCTWPPETQTSCDFIGTARSEPQPREQEAACHRNSDDDSQSEQEYPATPIHCNEEGFTARSTQGIPWDPSLAQLCRLKTSADLEIVDADEQTVGCWSMLKCAQAAHHASSCIIQIKEWRQRRALCTDRLMYVRVPRLKCVSHKCAFDVTEADPWSQIEQLQSNGRIVVSPEIVVLSLTLILTMKAYMCANLSKDFV